jgi:alkylation response protein AidB-like acyl-CoA dehydrogenase
MSSLARPALADHADLLSFAADFESWLATRPAALVGASSSQSSTDARMLAMRGLMGELSAEGWGRWGWPETFGGLGGTILHRAIMWAGLARHGVGSMAAFEHLEVLGPTLLALGPPEFCAGAFPHFLDGTETWAQGFSEPDAGSDLASIRTRATLDGDAYRISGRKIWTSWARFARWSLVLARTDSVESRHRGITAFIVDLQSPGVEVRSIAQANGHDELAEVSFDDVLVPADRLIGSLNGGWTVAMHILSSERGTFAWFRQCILLHHLQNMLNRGAPEADGLLGDAVLDLASVGALSMEALRVHEEGAILGPRAAFTKLVLCAAEQGLFDWALASDSDIVVDPFDEKGLDLRAAYLFSRIVTVYGGSQQMQLDTVAKQILQLPA